MAKITVTLTPESIDAAIEEVRRYKRKLYDRTSEIIKDLVDEGVEIAKNQLRELGAVYTGDLEASITGYFDEETGVGIIKTDSPYAICVEFGTGIVGEGSPHPAPEGWEYDINGHGEKGWWYFNERDQKWHWTKGIESRPFMYNTFLELQRLAKDEAKVVFKRD